MERNNKNNNLNYLIDNQNTTIKCIKIKQVYSKLEKDLMSIFDGLRNNSKNKQLNGLRSKTANDLIGYFRKTPTNSLDILIVIDDKEVADVQFVYDKKRKQSVFKLLLKK